MYLNECAWKKQIERWEEVDAAMKKFLHLYAGLSRELNEFQLYVSKQEEPYFRSPNFTINQWLSQRAEKDEERLFRLFWNRRKTYEPSNEYELWCGEDKLEGGLEAYLDDSYMVSICLDRKWAMAEVSGELVSLDEETKNVSVRNLYSTEQIDRLSSSVDYIGRKVYSYEELWKKRNLFFPELVFCPSVEKDMAELDRTYLNQIIKKLVELNTCCREHAGQPFRSDFLRHASPETEVTLKRYEKEHTFTDEEKKNYIASWHIRFTGIPGRIFFIPDYKEAGKMLICYIGRKLPTVEYPT